MHLLRVLILVVGALLAVPPTAARSEVRASYVAPQAPSGRPIPTAFVALLVDPPLEAAMSCVPSNPSCGRDPWWAERDELQLNDAVQYSFIGPGLVTEARFIEAIWLLWQWPQGRALLIDAADHGVQIAAASGIGARFAYYRASNREVVVNRQFTDAATWMVADILAHELTHAADDRAGVLGGGGQADCLAREEAAYRVERRYLVWVSDRFGGLPNPDMVRSHLADEEFLVYRNLLDIGMAPDIDAKAVEDYRRDCRR